MNSFNIRQLLTCFIFVLFQFVMINKISNAQPYDYYKPLALITPSHFDSKEYSFSLGYDGGIDLNFSYTISKQIVLITASNLNYFSCKRRESVNYTINKNDISGLAGFGYFKHRQNSFFNIVELYYAIQFTSVDNYVRKETSTSESTDAITKSKYITFFGQIQTNAQKKKYGLCFSSRISYNHFFDFEYYRRSETQINKISQGFSLLAAEPAIEVSLPLKSLRVRTQIGVSLPIYSQTANLNEINVASDFVIDYTENYGDFYFFWRFSIYYLKTKWKLR